jgi:4-hydroxy-2-oxoheptanedioate aldolase
MAIDTTKLRPSRVLAKLRAGGVASCIKLNLGDARVAEIAARAGFDCIWTDREHVPNTLEQIENQIRAAKVYDVDTIVRVPRGSYSELVWPLEMDAAGIMVPHVMSAADARKITHQARFHPIGRRPLDGGNADGGYCTVPVAEYLRQANEQRLVIVQIEDPEPLEELEQIAAVPGIDMLFFGPGDFSQGIGHPGEMAHPRIVETRRRVAAVAREYGKFAGTVGTLSNLTELTEMGYQFVSVGADVIALVQAFGEIAAAFGQAARGVVGAYGSKAAP